MLRTTLALITDLLRLLRLTFRFVVRAPKDEAFGAAFREVASSHGLEPEGLVRIPQVARNGGVYDTEDRVLFGVQLVTDLLSMKPR